MYQGVLYSLLTLLGISGIAGAFGWLPFLLISQLSSVVILVSVCVVVNAGFSYVLGKPMRHESSTITGLILFFLLAPAGSLNEYISISLVAAIAAASKYVLAYKGRHIFNPAAIAVVIAPLIGLPPALWWVATPLLALPVLAFGTFLLYRTNRFQMGYLYILLSFVVLVVTAGLKSGVTPTLMIAFVTSYPLLFLGFFMLTEPLTQAPKHNQRLIITAIVALLANIHLALGPIFFTPEVALVIGNFIGFMFGQRSGIRLKLERKEELAGDQVAYYFSSKQKLNYQAGQYMELSLLHKHPDLRGQRRKLTIASSPDNEEVRFVVRHRSPVSSFKSALAKLPKNAWVEATGIYGDFVLPKNINEKLLFIAGGIGITPFLAQLETVRLRREKRDVLLLYFVNTKADAVYIDELNKTKKYGLQYQIIDSRPAFDIIDRLGDISERTVYLSGPPVMINATKGILKKATVRRVVTDQFDGY